MGRNQWPDTSTGVPSIDVRSKESNLSFLRAPNLRIPHKLFLYVFCFIVVGSFEFNILLSLESICRRCLLSMD